MAQVAFALGKNVKAIWMGSSKSRHPSQPLKEAHRSLLCSVLLIYYWCYWCDLSLARLEFGSFIWEKNKTNLEVNVSPCRWSLHPAVPRNPQDPLYAGGASWAPGIQALPEPSQNNL